jgi:dihydrofolate reductase
MKKIIVQEMVSVDGFFAGPNGELDWHNVDAEFNEYAIAMLDSMDTLIFGRVTYDLMSAFWPSSEALKDDPIVASKMNSLPKIVFSKSSSGMGAGVDMSTGGGMGGGKSPVVVAASRKPLWNNTTMIGQIDADEIRKMKSGSKFGSKLGLSSGLTASAEDKKAENKSAENKNMVILGSGTIVSAFTRLGLIDEYRLIVNPVLLGKGKPLFTDIEKTLKLKLASTHQFKSGNVLLVYVP